ncbi:hypothetical protein O181_049127 [Austropuccinia psidii MF-1]|uniref:Uncharacterized protein n=1 Tax=Austropuccinia psidii MF-1 TaxID=1389203 RepID=A0A9Q3HMB6_9BASI|nr:hypothetical protein [Austropuccinia psidii MF-1]
MQDIPLTQSKKNGKRRGSTSYTAGGSPSEPTLPGHVRPEESPSSPTPGPRATSTPETESRPQPHQIREIFSTPTNPSPLKHQILRKEMPFYKIKAKDYNLNLNEEEVEKCIRKVEKIAQIDGARKEYLAMQMAFWTTDSKISGAIKGITGYE